MQGFGQFADAVQKRVELLDNHEVPIQFVVQGSGELTRCFGRLMREINEGEHLETNRKGINLAAQLFRFLRDTRQLTEADAIAADNHSSK